MQNLPVNDNSEYIHRFERAIFVLGNITRAQALISGMNAENQLRAGRGESPAYYEDDYTKLLDDCGLDHNSLVSQLFHR